MYPAHAPRDQNFDGLLRAVAAHFPNGSINVYDRELRYVFADGEGLAAAGLAPGTLIGRSLNDLFAPDSVAFVEPFYRRAFDGESVRFDLPVFERVYRISAGPLTVEDQRVTTIVAVAQDITEEKQREAALLAREHERRELAEQANRAKDQFLSLVSHELRTPINAILGWSEVLAGAPTPSASEQAIRAIRRSASHQQRLIEDLLDISRIAGGTLRLTLGEVDLQELFTAVVESVLPQATAKGIHLDARYPSDIGTMKGDRDRLQQALANLLTNAIKFTPRRGSIRLEGLATRDALEIQVIDTGLGISPDFLPRVFDRFAKIDRSPQRQTGLGLGLALAKDIIRAHGGTIQVHSDGVGLGTTVTVSLPRAPPR